jgi:hypothetical protein
MSVMTATATMRTWRDIPAVPIAAFKAATLACEPIAEAEAVFMSSGTTGGAVRQSRHSHPHLRLYHASVQATFAGTVVPDVTPGALPMLALVPPHELPNFSLAHWLDLVMREFGASGNRFALDRQGLDLPGISAALREADARRSTAGRLRVARGFV